MRLRQYNRSRRSTAACVVLSDGKAMQLAGCCRHAKVLLFQSVFTAADRHRRCYRNTTSAARFHLIFYYNNSMIYSSKSSCLTAAPSHTAKRISLKTEGPGLGDINPQSGSRRSHQPPNDYEILLAIAWQNTLNFYLLLFVKTNSAVRFSLCLEEVSQK